MHDVSFSRHNLSSMLSHPRSTTNSTPSERDLCVYFYMFHRFIASTILIAFIVFNPFFFSLSRTVHFVLVLNGINRMYCVCDLLVGAQDALAKSGASLRHVGSDGLLYIDTSAQIALMLFTPPWIT